MPPPSSPPPRFLWRPGLCNGGPGESAGRTLNWKLVIFLHPSPEFPLLLLVTGYFFFLFLFFVFFFLPPLGKEVLISNRSFNPFDVSPAPGPAHHPPRSGEFQHSRGAVVLRLEQIGSPSYFIYPPTPQLGPRSDEHSVLITTLLLSLFDNYFLLMLLLRLLFLRKKNLSRQKVCLSLLI